MAYGSTAGCHVMSDLLTIREKGLLTGLLEPRCKLIKTTVAQILQAEAAEGERPRWSCLHCGVLCLTEDESLQSYFLRLYCVERSQLLWEQELYVPFKYTAARAFFHTFPADGHHVGLNFANEMEAEEFHLAVEAAHEKTASRIQMMKTARNSITDPPDSGIKLITSLDEEKHFVVDEPSTTSPTTCPDLDPAMRRLLKQARLTEDDLRHKDVAEAVDCIIEQFGGLKAVRGELRSRGLASQTLPRAARSSLSLALKKGPLPAVPSIRESSSASQQTPPGSDSSDRAQVGPRSPFPPPVTERIKKSASFKHVGSSTAAESGDLILTALKEVFRQKQMFQ
ncbi:actin nucleation-promoting factor WASL [Embiotoca jacksoni]|uniref:actin nucleation-promoting factor WASL n=1 Tax=Embiotoca jacksoni TaxID=100190 RepID=UPI003703C777